MGRALVLSGGPVTRRLLWSTMLRPRCLTVCQARFLLSRRGLASPTAIRFHPNDGITRATDVMIVHSPLVLVLVCSLPETSPLLVPNASVTWKLLPITIGVF